MLAIFAGTATSLPHASSVLRGFVQGIHLAFWVMVGISAIAAVLSALRDESQRPDSDSTQALAMRARHST
jgi:hypothetical protein